jgi:predicted alpha/beta hydrolase family esterase
VAALERAVSDGSRDLMLVAHSLACVAVAHFAAAHATSRVVGALLVAPADVDSDTRMPRETRSFRPMPLMRLPFSSVVVASTTDEYVSVERAQYFAQQWGAEFANVGPAGHINADAGLGPWTEGHAILERLITRVAPR